MTVLHPGVARCGCCLPLKVTACTWCRALGARHAKQLGMHTCRAGRTGRSRRLGTNWRRAWQPCITRPPRAVTSSRSCPRSGESNAAGSAHTRDCFLAALSLPKKRDTLQDITSLESSWISTWCHGMFIYNNALPPQSCGSDATFGCHEGSADGDERQRLIGAVRKCPAHEPHAPTPRFLPSLQHNTNTKCC